VPFGLGVALAQVLHPRTAAGVPPLGFALFLGTALSITAIPVLGRIMLELGITRTRLGAVTLAAAAADDAAGWILLASVAAVVRAAFDPAHTLLMAAETLAFGLAMALLARPVLCAWARHTLRRGGGELNVAGLAVLLALVLGCATVTNLIGIFAVFGAFLLGVVLSGEEEFREAVNRRLRDFVTALFVPLFFAYTGLRTDVGSLGSAELWLLCGVMSAAVVLGKFGGCGVGERLLGARGGVRRGADEHARADGAGGHQRRQGSRRRARERLRHAGADGAGHDGGDDAGGAAADARHGTGAARPALGVRGSPPVRTAHPFFGSVPLLGRTLLMDRRLPGGWKTTSVM
jgi:Kef-type K+ transport system membrane component KefB